MIIGVPREIKEQEYRVALLPSAAYQLIKRGHTVVVERGAGVGAGYPDLEINLLQFAAIVTDDRKGINHFVVEVEDLKQLQAILQSIREVRDVFNVERVRGL